MLIQGAQKRHKILCAREIQKSINDSVHSLLVDQIEALNLTGFYTVTKTSIIGKNGTEFLFTGLRSNISNIKSIPGITRAWIEEAQTVSNSSMKVLIPTVREDGSEIWLSFNPELEDDDVYQNFVIDPPADSIVVKIGWQDNPWFPDVLRAEKDELKRKNPTEYEHVWEGNCKQAIDGAIFATELRLAAEEQRITRVAVKSGIPVNTFWDLGQSDSTAIWFVQIVGLEYRIVDYYQNSGEKMPHYIEKLAERPYLYGEHCLPHDADSEQLAAKSTIKQQLSEAIRNNPKLGTLVRVVPRIAKKALGIDAARSIFGQCLFDKEKTTDGLQCLRRYAYAKDIESGRISKEPKHDIWSHGCLTAGSVILTSRGNVKISDVIIGDMVYTPRGFARVTASGVVKKAKKLIEIKTSTGETLLCTPEHKIMTQKGFVFADALLYSDRLFNGGEWQCTLISLISMVFGLGFRETITGKTSGHSQGHQTYTERFGNSIMDKFLKDLKSTIKMATHLIMPLKTSNALMASSISGCMDWRVSHKGVCHQSFLLSHWKKRQNGTALMREEDGMKPMALIHGKIANGLTALAMNAAKYLSRLILLVPVGAIRIVHLRTLEGVGELVYDLTIENHACYQANGLMVSNSDAFLCFAQHFKRHAIEVPQQQYQSTSFWAQ